MAWPADGGERGDVAPFAFAFGWGVSPCCGGVYRTNSGGSLTAPSTNKSDQRWAAAGTSTWAHCSFSTRFAEDDNRALWNASRKLLA